MPPLSHIVLFKGVRNISDSGSVRRVGPSRIDSNDHVN